MSPEGPMEGVPSPGAQEGQAQLGEPRRSPEGAQEELRSKVRSKSAKNDRKIVSRAPEYAVFMFGLAVVVKKPLEN